MTAPRYPDHRGILFIVSIGLLVIFGVLKIINFAHGAWLTVGGYCALIGDAKLGLQALGAPPLALWSARLLGGSRSTSSSARSTAGRWMRSWRPGGWHRGRCSSSPWLRPGRPVHPEPLCRHRARSSAPAIPLYRLAMAGCGARDRRRDRRYLAGHPARSLGARCDHERDPGTEPRHQQRTACASSTFSIGAGLPRLAGVADHTSA